MQYGSWNDILVHPDDLIAFAWSAPMRDLAAKLGISDVGLRKQLVKCGVHVPPQGYWNKLKAGKAVPAMPISKPRKPGDSGRVRVDRRFAAVLPIAGAMAAKGPFASPFVPEDLDELYQRELAAIGAVAIPRSLDRAHSGLGELLRKDEKRQAKFEATGWQFHKPLFRSPLALRQLRILNAMFHTLAKRGHSGSVYDRDEVLSISAQIGDTYVGLDLSVLGKPNLRPLQIADLPATTSLVLRVTPRFDAKASKTWQDDEDGKLEAKVASIAAALIVEGEAKFRRELQEHEALEEKLGADRERARLQRLEELNAVRLERLKESGDLLRQAHDIRTLVAEVRKAMQSGDHPVDPTTLGEWVRWALGEADRLDPIKSGQFTSHLYPPTEP